MTSALKQPKKLDESESAPLKKKKREGSSGELNRGDYVKTKLDQGPTRSSLNAERFAKGTEDCALP